MDSSLLFRIRPQGCKARWQGTSLARTNHHPGHTRSREHDCDIRDPHRITKGLGVLECLGQTSRRTMQLFRAAKRNRFCNLASLATPDCFWQTDMAKQRNKRPHIGTYCPVLHDRKEVGSPASGGESTVLMSLPAGLRMAGRTFWPGMDQCTCSHSPFSKPTEAVPLWLSGSIA